MKFYTTPYHSNLLKDNDRLAVFFEGIMDYYHYYNVNVKKDTNSEVVVFDIGSGSGILSYFASKYFDHVIAIEKDNKIIDCAKKSFESYNVKNVSFINEDASSYEFQHCADLIICEMLDTALIDEEEVPVLNHIRKYLNKDGKIIPQGVINIAEPVFMEKDYIHYEDEEYHNKLPNYEVLGDFVKFSEFDFLNHIESEFKTIIKFKLSNSLDVDELILNGIKLTMFTKINENIICGPTPMLNPPLFVPLEISNKNVAKDEAKDEVSVKLEYIMGGGIETIKATLL